MHPSCLPFAVYLLAAGTFLMGTTEFVVAGILPEGADAFEISVSQAGPAITVFAIGMVVGAPAMALLTLRLPHRVTLVLSLVVFGLGHVGVVLAPDFAFVLAMRAVTALATGAFWAVAAVVAVRLAGPGRSAGALGIVLGGGMLANALGVPLGAFLGQASGWHGPFAVLAALALVYPVFRLVPASAAGAPPLAGEVRSLGSGRMWLALAACVLINAGVMGMYSFVAPLLTDRAGIAPGAVPLVLLAFGAGALVGNVVAGRLGDARPFATVLVLRERVRREGRSARQDDTARRVRTGPPSRGATVVR
ncbi:MFS transporter [Microbacterium sp. ZXX196]|uniref:MFS transporter n=1 Tax=Microbacterium sp. ZXX196 TaxID=2609291 RepID=UPI0012B886F3|nr:MFS transporter [Microbacterium sp. ZXX196]MTE22682.1 MFS transporter [Microbacterium sp. ZXX196]